MKKLVNTKESILEKTKISENGCWEWTGCLNRKGYGEVCFNAKHQLVHRLSYGLHKGEIPKGMLVCHTCDNPKCINPDHLFLGTPKDNTQDMLNKGRAKGGPPKRTHCKKGHEFIEDNIYTRANGDRLCKICKNESQKLRRKSKNQNV